MKMKFTEYLTDMGFFLIGGALYAFAINFFTAPNNIAPAGVTGIATVLNFVFDIPIGLAILAINVPLALFGIFFLGSKFMLKTCVATVIYSLLIDLGSLILPQYKGDRLLSAVYGGLISGFALALAFWRGGSTGGTDIIARLMYSYRPQLSMGRVILLLDVLTIGIASFVYGDINSALYSLVVAFAASTIIDRVLYGNGGGKLFYIVSKNSSEIASRIFSEMDRGVTYLKAEGGYRHGEQRVIMCAVRRNELFALNRIIRETDENAFTIVCEAGEILGFGFQTEHRM